MQFRILGPLEVQPGGAPFGSEPAPVDLGPPKQRAVLAILLLDANRVVALDRLADLLWGDRPPARAIDALRVYVSCLRRALEPHRPPGAPPQVLVTRPPGYLLRVGEHELDAWRFERLADHGRLLLAENDPAGARLALSEALSLWRGPALGDFAFEAFAEAEAIRLEERRWEAVEDQVEAELALGHAAGVIPELRALARERPLRERRWGLLILALYRAQRQSEALRTYAEARDILRDELGVEPGPALRRLHDQILAQSPSLDHGPPLGGPGWVPLGRIGFGPLASPARRSRRLLVGRQQQLHVLRTALTCAQAGEGSVVLISGEPGIGKTRLAEELAALAAQAGSTVAWGRCHDGEGAPAFWPWVQVLRRLLTTADAARLRRALGPGAGVISQIVPEIRQLVPELEPPANLDPAALRFRLYESVVSFLTALCADRPLVVVLEDLHWADVASLALLEWAAADLDRGCLLLACTYRDVDPALEGPLAGTLGALARQPGLERLALSGLSEPEVGQFMAQTAGIEPAPGVVTAVHTRTDGNPFFVAELARLMAADGALASTAGLGQQVPAGVRDVIRRRRERLPPATADLLAQAAVLGRDVDVRLLAAAAGCSEGEVVDRLGAAVDVGILGAGGDLGGGYRFAHALVQETVYDELGGPRRAELHRRAAQVIEGVYGAEDGCTAELAHHLFQATSVLGPEPAFAAAIRAAEVAQRRLAYEQAKWQLERARQLVAAMPAGPERNYRELDVHHRLAALLSVTSGYHSTAVAQAWSRARNLCRSMGDTPEVLASLWGLARVTRSRGEFEASDQLGQQLLDLFAASGRPEFALAGHEARGLAAFFTGDPSTSVEHLAQAVDLSDDPAITGGRNTSGTPCTNAALVLHPGVSCRVYLACARWILGRDEGNDGLIDTAVQLAATTGQPLNHAISLLYAAKLSSMRGDADRTRAWAAEVRRIAESTAIGPLAPVGVILESWAGARLGRPEAGEAAIRAAMSDLQASGWRLAWTYFLALRGDASRLAGRLDPALTALDQGLASGEATGERYYEAELCRLKAEVMAEHRPRQPEDASAWLDRAVCIAGRQGATGFMRRIEASRAILAPMASDAAG